MASARSGVGFARALYWNLDAHDVPINLLNFSNFSTADQTTVINLGDSSISDQMDVYGFFRERVEGNIIYLVQQIESPLFKKPDVYLRDEAEFMASNHASTSEIVTHLLSRLTGLTYDSIDIANAKEEDTYLLISNGMHSHLEDTLACFPNGPLTIKYANRRNRGIKTSLVNNLLNLVDERQFDKLQVYLRDITATITPQTALSELIEMAYVLKQYGALEVRAILPYAPEARSHKQSGGDFRLDGYAMSRVKLAGIDEVIVVRPHSKDNISVWEQILGEGKLTTYDLLEDYADQIIKIYRSNLSEVVLVAPDKGETEEVKSLFGIIEKKTGIKVNYLVFNKKRAKANQVSDTDIVWEESYGLTNISELKGKKMIFVDDMVDTSETIFVTIGALNHSIKDVEASLFVTHAVGSFPFYQNITNAMDNNILKYFGYSDSVDYSLLEKKYGSRIIKFNTTSKIAQGIADKLMLH